ncbi:O-methyltransferase-domain-containing protein [Bombardia bombarda]|uniref:O-methyltransferase-domain-containing protein n=1 Tax=Bombardia bombarda TaxID=252184 RepID=A0AA40CA08_9PEZI|nr:O-methyltransferase-domain-containing protein [Bombardia bombarda]
MSSTRIAELAARIAANTARVNDYLEAHDLPQPSFDLTAALNGAVPKDAPEIEAARRCVIQDTAELGDLMRTPREYLTGFIQNDLLPQQAITRFNLARSFPVGSETTFAKMATFSGLSERDVRKIVRYAITQRIFTEPRPGVVAHSLVSRLLAEDAGTHDYVATCADELWPAAAQTCNAMAKWPGSEDVAETGFALANQTNLPIYEFLAQHPERERRFAHMMRSFTQGPAFDLRHVTDNYPWGSIGAGTVVDVGGSQGHASIALARSFPSLTFVVQDLPAVVDGARAALPPDLTGRVTFAAHDFFTPQPVHGADVYFLRWILHNWPDKYCIAILQNLIPALKAGARVVVCDAVVPAPGQIPREMERSMRGFDMAMSTIQNASEREEGEWRALFEKADRRFGFVGVEMPKGSGLGLVVVRWDG